MITIFTDGSSRGNPGPGGWGAIVAEADRVRELGGGEAQTTNNRMELRAVIEALKVSDGNIELHTDSEYIVKGITVWVKGWQNNNWKTAAKKPVLNQDLWQELLAASKDKDIRWVVVPGHSGVHANERCDEIATEFADGHEPLLFDGLRHEYYVPLSVSPRAL
ncbi:MAG: rnhA [Parcubacteria group bacterium]|nr:rnhA [Parcubacteria group bacterium]